MSNEQVPDSVAPQWAIPRGLILLLGAAGIFVGMLGLQQFQDIVGPAFLGLMLVVVVIPLQHWMIRNGWPRWLAITAVVVGAYAILLGLGLILLYAAARFAGLVDEQAASGQAVTQDAKDALASLGISEKQVEEAASSLSFSDISGAVTSVLTDLGNVAGSLIFVLAIIVFPGLDSLGFTERLRYTATTRADISGALTNFAQGTRTYLSVSTVFGAIVAVVDTVALWIMGIPAPVLWGFVAFVTNYIPNIGFVIGVIPPAVLALLVSGWQLMVAVIVVYSVINFVIQSIIQPKFVGDSVNLATTVTFLSMAIWTWTIGPLGALLAVPLTLLAKAILIDLDPNTRWIGTLLSATTPTEPPDRPGAEPITPAVVPAPDG